MKKMALIMVIALAFVTCDTGGGGGSSKSKKYTGYDGDGNAYTLVITKAASSNGTDESWSRAAYSPEGGDTYRLTYKTEYSTGTIEVTKSGATATITLNPEYGSGTATVTVSSSGIVSITATGDFSWYGGTSFTAPENLTTQKPGKPDKPGTNPGGSTSFPSTSGSLTITGLGAYNGKWVFAGADLNDNYDNVLLACDGGDDKTEKVYLTKITNGSATLKVWKSANDGESLLSYNGSDKNVEIAIIVMKQATISRDDFNFDIDIDLENIFALMNLYAAVGTGTANFSGGRATSVKFNVEFDMSQFPEYPYY
jgi:hypothetical protein